MLSSWRKATGLGLLLLVLGGLAAPIIASVTPEPCSGMAGASNAHEQAPLRCQWMTPTACCNEPIAAGAAAAFAPIPPAVSFQRAFPPISPQHRMLAKAAARTIHAAAHSTIVLRL